MKDERTTAGHTSQGMIDRIIPFAVVLLLALIIIPLDGTSDEKAVDNLPPEVDAGEDITGVLLNEMVMLDGSNTTDEDIDNCTWSWECTSHDDVEITGNDTVTPRFVVFIEDETITLQLTVTDPFGESDFDQVDIIPDVNEDPELDPLSILPADSGSEGPFYEISFPVEFNATTVSDTESSMDDLDFTWDSDVEGEGDFPSEPAFTRIMNIIGWHNITLTVTDPNGGESVLVKRIKVREDIQGPVAVMDIKPGKIVFDKGETLSLDASETTDPNSFDTLETMNFTWSTNISGGRVLGYGPLLDLTLEEGYHNLSLLVTDTDGLTSTDFIWVRVDNDPPVAVISMTEVATRDGIHIVNVSETALLSGWTSFDLNRDELTFNWVFGDGATASGENVTHAWGTYGTYNITLEVDDGSSYDNLANATKRLIVNTIPDAVIETPGDVIVGRSFLFSANGTTDEDEDELTYKWDLDGDGTYDQSGFNTTYTYREAEEEITVTLLVSDGHATSTAEILVSPRLPNDPPTARIVGWNEGDDPIIVALDDDRGEVELDATASIDPDDDANNNGMIDDDERNNLTYSWDLDAESDADRDGNMDNDFTKKGKTVRVQLEDDDLIKVRLNATDEMGVSSYLTILVQGDNPPEVTSLNSDKKFKVYVNSTIKLTSTASDPDSGQTRNLKYNWDLGDGTIKNDTSSSVTHSYSEPGTYEVYSWVTDEYLWGYYRTTITVVEFDGLDVRFPRNGATLKGKVMVRGSVDYLLEYKVDEVEISIDGGEWKEADNPPDWEYSLNTFSLTDGDHEMDIRVTLDTGVEQTVTIQFKVQNAVASDNSSLILGIVIFLVVLVVVGVMFFLLFGKKRSRVQDLMGPMPPPGAGPRVPGMVPPGGLPKPPQRSNLPPNQAPPEAAKAPEGKPPEDEGPGQVRIKCPSCKRVFKVDDTGDRPLMMTCTHCGAKGSISHVPGDEEEEEPEEEEEEEGPEPISIICPSCKGLFELDHVMDEATCPFCNAKGELDEDTREKLRERFSEETVEEVTVRCPSCQGKFSIKSTDKEIICPYCGVSGNV